MEKMFRKNDLRKMILDMIQSELGNYTSQKGAQKYFEANIDKIIESNINEIMHSRSSNSVYQRILKKGSYQNSVVSISRMLKKEDEFKSKQELIKFARYLGINVNIKTSYNNVLRRVANYIHTNKQLYSREYILYSDGVDEYALKPKKIKDDLIENYKLKMRKDMSSIAKLLDLNIDEEEKAEDIRKRVINHIIKEKIVKKD